MSIQHIFLALAISFLLASAQDSSLGDPSYIIDVPEYPTDTVPKTFLASNVSYGWFPWVMGICYDEQDQLVRFYISVTPCLAYANFLIEGKTIVYGFGDPHENGSFEDGVATFTSETASMIIDHHVPHNITIASPATTIKIIASYRGPPLWYCKSLNFDDMLPIPETGARIGGYEAPIEISGKIDGEINTKFQGYGDWEHVWFIGGGWKPPKSLWMIINNPQYYIEVASATYENGTVAWKVGRVHDVIHNNTYAFENFVWTDDNKSPPISVTLTGNVTDLKGNVAGTINITTDKSIFQVVNQIWGCYENITGTILNDTFSNGTGWSEARQVIPEFPVFVMIALFISGTLLAVILRRRHSPHQRVAVAP